MSVQLLYDACKRGDGDGALATRLVTMQTTDACGNRPLHVACLYNNTAMVRALLHVGADPEARNGRFERPVDLAVRAHASEAFELLWNPRQPVAAHRHALLSAVDERAPRIAAAVLFDCPPGARQHLAEEGALRAVRASATAVLEQLLAAHPQCARARDHGGRTIPHLAAEGRDSRVLAVALRAGGAWALHQPDGAGLQPLHVAARAGCAACVRILLAVGADPAAPTAAGILPATLAMRARVTETDARECVAALASALPPERRPALLLAAMRTGELCAVERAVAALQPPRDVAVVACVVALRAHFVEALDCLVGTLDVRSGEPCLMTVAAETGQCDAMARLWRLGRRAQPNTDRTVRACVEGGAAVVDYAHRTGMLSPGAAAASALRRCGRSCWRTRSGQSVLPELAWLGYDALDAAPDWDTPAGRAHRRGRAAIAREQRLALARVADARCLALDLWEVVACALPTLATAAAYARLPARRPVARVRLGGTASEPPAYRPELARTRAQEDTCLPQ